MEYKKYSLNIIKVFLILISFGILFHSGYQRFQHWQNQLRFNWKIQQEQQMVKETIQENKNQAKVAMKVKLSSPMQKVHGNQLEKHYTQIAFNYWDKLLNFPIFDYWQPEIYFQSKTNKTYNYESASYVYGLTVNGKDPYMSVYADKSHVEIYINDKDAQRDGVSISRVIAHELGHALGLNHDYGLMAGGKPYGSWKVKDEDLVRIKQGNWNVIGLKKLP